MPYSSKDICNLKSIGLLSQSRDGKHIRPRSAAYRLLSDAGYNFKQEAKPQTNEAVLRRRNIASQILFTFFMAGISVFNDEFNNTIDEPVYIASFAARARDSGNPFGSTRFYGIFCTAQRAFLVLYADDIGVYYQKELTLFHSLTEITGIRNTAIIIMGKSTSSISATVINAQKGDKGKKKYNTNSFAQIFETTTLPVHFIPIGDPGVQILKFLLIPNYREEISRAILKKNYSPPYEGITDSDTIHVYNNDPRNPAVVAFDMDVNRIDRAVINAQNAGFDKICIYALAEQIPFLKSRYSNTGRADVRGISIDNIKRFLSYNIDLYQPPSTLYVTDEGRCFDVSDITGYRKTGKQN